MPGRNPATASSVATWAGLKELVFASLTGHLAVDESSASSSGLWSLRDRAWHPPALAAAGIAAATLPPVLATTDARPLSEALAAATGLRADLPVVIGAGDGPAANLGVGATDRGVAALSIGTSALVYPAAGFVSLAQDWGAKAIEVNLEPTPLSSQVDVSVLGKAGELVPRLVDMIIERVSSPE